MIVLGIESTAHTIGMGISSNKNIIANENHMYKPKKEGLIPRKMADHHAEWFPLLFKRIMKNRNMEDVDAIAFSQGPGIGSPLSIGYFAARYLAIRYKKQVIGVNHPYAHLKIGEQSTGLRNPLVLYLSGGNSQILFEGKNGLQVVGETLDIGIGNLFDSFAREIKMKYAHGSALAELAEEGKYIKLPYNVKGMNFVFGGLLTKSIDMVKKGKRKQDVAFSLMETSFSMVCEALERALYLTKRKSILLCGGVAQNKRLQEMVSVMAEEAGVKFGVGPDEYNKDNGAMIAYTGELLYKYKKPVDFWKPLTDYRIEDMRKVLLKKRKG
ncbi:tRNA (adenosine(37)-N6)-threonylcarbamoyltransferase complex transferase subunit TsaD [Candidatus Micrarchaeota archaeon]|nr:tRNA (adenosine(37)-N6)-threonylcarbamoyltransferase complex transferase subunit TsaD [Candidatus Micrarchaeota archaeon]